jgi:hypothetical protein
VTSAITQKQTPEKEESLAKRTNESSLKEYEHHTYEELSQEFEELYPAAARAFELIPLMYNRLTLVDGLTHKDAVEKIYNDHHHLSGFTQRNIRRYLPGDNPNIPRRVRTSRPKNSITEISAEQHISDTEHTDESNQPQSSKEQNINKNNFEYEILDFEFHLEWEQVRQYLGDRYKSGRALEVWFGGKLDKRTGKVIAAYVGRKEERNAVSKGSQSDE